MLVNQLQPAGPRFNRVPPERGIKERVVSDGRFELYNDGRLFDLDSDFDEKHSLPASRDPSASEARRRIQEVLNY